MNADAPRFTGVLADIARVAGDEAALAIGRKLGGTRVYFPGKPKPTHWLSGLVGPEAAQAICEELTAGFSGRIDIPLGQFGHQEEPRQKVDRMLVEGKNSVRDIALATRNTERAVFFRKAKKRDAKQGDLF